MNITDIFIKRPILAIVISLIILIGGIEAMYFLNITEYPRSDISIIKVTTNYIGASADLVRGYITTPLETTIAAAEGIDYIESTSIQNVSTILVHLKLNYDPNIALTQIQTKLAQVSNVLPPVAEKPIIELQNSDDIRAILYLAFSSKDMPLNKITDFLSRVIQPKLTSIPGIQRATILGERVIAMRIWIKGDRLAAYGISANDIKKALESNNCVAAIGRTKGSMTSINLISNTNLKSVEEFKQLVVKQNGTSLVHLEDIADIELGAEDYDSDVRFDGQNARFIGIWPLPTANVITVCSLVKSMLPELNRMLPPGMEMKLVYNSTEFIVESIHDIIKTLIETLIIVILVIFFFLGSIRTVFIPVVTIPISLIGTMLIMLIFGLTINLITLLAIVLSIGLVVDDSIVVVENVERHIRNGESPFHAAIFAAQEIVGPIAAMTLALIAVYIPIAFQGGLTGALFRSFSLTLVSSIFLSAVVAITLSPMMCSLLLNAEDEKQGYHAIIHKFLIYVEYLYIYILRKVLYYRTSLWLIALMGIILFPVLYLFSGKELAPKEDQGIILGIIQASPFSTLEQSLLYTQMVGQAYRSIPGALHLFEITNPSSGFIGAIMKPWDQRTETCESLIPSIRNKTAQIPGLRVIPTIPPSLPGGSNFTLEFMISSTLEPKEILEYANILVETAMKSGLFIYADTDIKYDQPETEIIFDRNKVASLGLNLEQVTSDLEVLIGGKYINRFSIQGRSYKVIPQLKRNNRLNTDDLLSIYVTASNGGLFQLSNFAFLKTSAQPRSINRFQQFNSAKIYGILVPGVTLDQALKVLEKKANQLLPHGYSIDYAGESRQLRKEGNNLTLTMFFSTIFIFLLLSAQFESFRTPFIILIGSVPLALSSALIFTFLGFTTINIYTQIGLITLIGLIAKNGILIVDFANQLQKSGKNKLESIIEASGIRLRPVLMTTACTVLGHISLILAHGPGSGARNSIGIILVSGMIIGTLFTLFIIPSIYLLFADNYRKNRSLILDII